MPKNCRYRIDDCFFRFWFRFIYKYQHLIEQKMFDELERKRTAFFKKNPQLRNRSESCGGLSLAEM